MKWVLLILGVVIAYGVFETIRFRQLVAKSVDLIESATPYMQEGSGGAILVVGDSIAAGVGADSPRNSLAGRLGSLYPDYSVENYAVSGARVDELAAQVARTKRDRYDLILVVVGANDIIRFRSPQESVRILEPQLRTLADMSDTVILMTAGNVGGAALFPFPLSSFYHARSLAYHDAFGQMAERAGVTYVNLYVPPEDDVFVREPETYLAVDGLHPSSKGYEVWFTKLKEALGS